jgi:predicted aspartyl protease
MGIFHTAFRVERYPGMKRGITIQSGLVDTGAEFTWVPAQQLQGVGIRPVKVESFSMADGKIIKRDVGFAVVRLSNRFTVGEVVFAQPGDLTPLGARTLEGLGLSVDARRRRLVAAGPAPAATAVRPGVAKAMGIVVPELRRKRRKPARKPKAATLKPKSRVRRIGLGVKR